MTEQTEEKHQREAAARAHALHEAIVDTERRRRALDLTLGRLFLRMQDTKGWALLDEPSFDSYLARPELGIARRTAWRLIRIVRLVDSQHGPAAKDSEQCHDGTPVLTEEQAVSIGVVKSDLLASIPGLAALPCEQREELIASAQTLSVPALRQHLQEQDGGELPEDLRWLEEVGQRIISRANKLTTHEAPRDLLDEIVAIAMDAHEKLDAVSVRGSGVGRLGG